MFVETYSWIDRQAQAMLIMRTETGLENWSATSLEMRYLMSRMRMVTRDRVSLFMPEASSIASPVAWQHSPLSLSPRRHVLAPSPAPSPKFPLLEVSES